MNLNYKIQYSDRKTFGLIIDRDKKIIIKSPKKAKKIEINNFFNKKKEWIYNKLKNENKYKKTNKKELISGSSIIYLGNEYNLDIGKYQHEGILFDEKFLISKKNKTKINKLLKDWYINEANKFIPKITNMHSKNLGVSYNNLKIKDLKYRWGSCTDKNNIYFNWKLIKAPMFIINYVILHELTHIIEKNHNERFWRILKTQMPNYEKAKKWLENNGKFLEIEFKSNSNIHHN